MTTRGFIRTFASVEALAAAAAEEFVRRSSRAIAQHGRFAIALAGGNTPRLLFAHLAGPRHRRQVRWDRVHFFWGDERTVPPDSADSNFGLANQLLLSPIGIRKENIHRIRSELGSDEAADAYEHELRLFFNLAHDEIPRFDLIFLGLGEDGHTASLFPGADAVGERRRLVTSTWVARLEMARITLTLPVLNRGVCVLFLVAGEGKAEVLRRVLESPPSAEYPASLVQPDGELLWFVDGAAGHLLRDGVR